MCFCCSSRSSYNKSDQHWSDTEPQYSTLNLQSCCHFKCSSKETCCCLFCDVHSKLSWAVADNHAEGHDAKSEGLYGSNPTMHLFIRLLVNDPKQKRVKLTVPSSSDRTAHAMPSAGKAGNGYIGNWNRGTSLILREYQIHSHRPGHLSDWNLSLETILCKSKTRGKWRFSSSRMLCFVTGQVPHSASEDSDAFKLMVRQSKKKALWSTETLRKLPAWQTPHPRRLACPHCT